MNTQSFHNTVRIEGPELQRHESKAQHLQSVILEWLKSRPGQKYTPWQVWDLCCGQNNLIGSVRRALTNLATMEGAEIKDTLGTDEWMIERTGVRNYFWYYPAPVKVGENGQIEMI